MSIHVICSKSKNSFPWQTDISFYINIDIIYIYRNRPNFCIKSIKDVFVMRSKIKDRIYKLAEIATALS